MYFVKKLGVKCVFLLFLFPFFTMGQAIINEELVSLETYGFSNPNPVPVLGENPKIFPYFKFDSYQHKSTKKKWKVVTLENDYIKLWVLPEIGGKVWGAIEKSTGEEFLYKNDVVKFRNIAMRGPWTSGGIEFNFGIIGHHPGTATPVDYKTQTNSDGSVSCFVGNTDLPSNTKWTVEIRLEKDKAYFETNAAWYNASPLTQSYYNWMTGAAVATQDLEFFIPGNAYVTHGGMAHSWPIDEEGRDLSKYKNNAFGPDKSYHVVGEYNDFFGGYYHDTNFGFGQWAPYEEMPGQKLWLWSQSRNGGIWEDLLTDADGQYIEFQAGRLLDQYFPGETNPISQVGFDPFVMDSWSEIWFPFKEIGGMVDASKEGVLNVTYSDGETKIGLNALQNINSTLQVHVNRQLVLEESIRLKPMEVIFKSIPTKTSDTISVKLIGTELEFTNHPNKNQIKRPFHTDENLKVSESQELYEAGLEAIEFREYSKASEKLKTLVALDPSHRLGHIALADLEYRKTNYDAALAHCNTVLKMDTYNSGANYVAGITYRALGDHLNALESLGWAARDIKYRSVAYAQMAEIELADRNLDRAKMYAVKALSFNVNNLNAREVLLLTARLENNENQFKEYLNAILATDPLNHFVNFEKARFSNFASGADTLFRNGIGNEFKGETILQIALRYHQLNFKNEAVLSLLMGKNTVKNNLWASYLQQETNEAESTKKLEKAVLAPVNFVFPYRRESIPMLQWAVNANPSWKLKYYLAQNYFAVGLAEKGKSILTTLENEPTSDVFYRFRASIMDDIAANEQDYQKALTINAKDWKVWEEAIQFYLKNSKFQEAYTLSNKAYKKFKGNYNIDLAHAAASVHTGKFKETTAIIKKIQVLPYEHAGESRTIYERAYLGIALAQIKKGDTKAAIATLKTAKEWPENIGVGKPYTPDERKQNYLLALCYGDNNEKATSILEEISQYTLAHKTNSDVDHLFGLLALKKLDRQDDLNKIKNELRDTPKNQLAIALFNNNDTKIKTLATKLKSTKDILALYKYAIEN